MSTPRGSEAPRPTTLACVRVVWSVSTRETKHLLGTVNGIFLKSQKSKKGSLKKLGGLTRCDTVSDSSNNSIAERSAFLNQPGNETKNLVLHLETQCCCNVTLARMSKILTMAKRDSNFHHQIF